MLNAFLFDAMEEKVMTLHKIVQEDGEGGRYTTWVDGFTFDASFEFNSSMQARIAEKDGVTSLYTITYPPDVKLEYHDVLKRLSDGKVFRVTSDGDDIKTPEMATFQFRKVTAEEYVLA